MITVAIVSPSRSLEPISEVVAEYDFGCEFHKYIYKELSEIDRIYADCRDSCDVIFFSGELGYHYIMKRFPDIKIPCAFTAYGPKDILSILLNFHLEHPGIPLNRIFVDFLTPLNNFMDMRRYIKPEFMPYFFEDGVYDYDHITKYTNRLWKSGKIDVVISRSINNLPRLDEMHIPYLAVFPSKEMIKESIETALNALRLNQIEPKEYETILIRLPFETDCPQEEREYRMATLYKLLVDYRKRYARAFSISIGISRIALNAENPVNLVTAGYLRDFILYLKSNLDFPFRVGIGLHTNEDRSLYCAERALLEAVKHGADDGFSVCGGDETLAGPLSSPAIPTYSYANEKVTALGHRLGIGEANIFKLVGLFQSDPNILLTAASISRLLNITPRSANRILVKLSELGLIAPADNARADKRKGRPRRYYRFLSAQVLNILLPD